MFLTADELSQLTGYRPNQKTRICRWLDNRGIPHTENRLGEPVVLKSAIENKNEKNVEPNFDWLKRA